MNGLDPRLQSKAWRRLRLLILDRDRHACQIRGPKCTGAATQVDHVIDRADGGAVFDPRNLRAACSACNGWRAAERTNTMRRYRTGLAEYVTRL
jgi:5-methylcytosine-specific restriction enzyme A